MRLSVGVPLYNEEQVIPELLRRVIGVLDTLPDGPHEVVCVDDGSSDRSRALLQEIAAGDARVRIVVLSRNFGHQVALGAALDHATGDVVVLMDGDLQDEPEVIHQFLQLHRAGADVVYATRATRDESRWRQVAYKVFYRIARALSDVDLPLDAGDFALLGPNVVAVLRRLPEQQRYLRGLRAWTGFRQVAVPVHRAARFAGTRKYSLWRLLTLALDGICSFSVLPLRAAMAFGLAAMAITAVFALYAVYVRFVHGSPPGFTAALLVYTFMAGVQLFFLGVIGEYLGRVYAESKRRPAYVVAEVVGER